MASRFGAVNSTQNYATKIRWLIGFLVSVIVILGVAIMLVSRNSDAKQDQPTVEVELNVETVTSTIDVLVAATRVEEGSSLDARMFSIVPMSPEKVPETVILGQDINTLEGKFASRMIKVNMPLVLDDVSDTPPLSSIPIPPGYRAVSILVNQRSGVEGYAKANTRVDVLWTYSEGKSQKKVATIARFVKVLSVGGNSKNDGKRAQVKKETTVTLLVTEKDAKKIELARSLGTISLSLVGERETAIDSEGSDTVTVDDLIGRRSEDGAEDDDDPGVMFTTDQNTGRQLRYVLRKGRWKLDRSFGGSE